MRFISRWALAALSVSALQGAALAQTAQDMFAGAEMAGFPVTINGKTLWVQAVTCTNASAVYTGCSGGGGGGGSTSTTANASAPTLTEGSSTNPLYVDLSGGLRVSTHPVTQSGTWTVTANLAAGSNAIGSITNTGFNVTGTLPAYAAIPTFKLDQTTPGTTNGVVINSSALPTGAATSANQTTELSTLSTISGQLPATLGAKTSAASTSFAPASDAIFLIGGTAASGATATSNPLRNGCIFNTTQPTITTGQITDSQCSNRGELKVQISSGGVSVGVDTGTSGGGALAMSAYPSSGAGAAGSQAQTATAASSLTAKASSGNLYAFSVTPTVAGYIMAFNATTPPADGTVTPLLCYAVPANGTLDKVLPTPYFFATGITLAFSTGANCFTKTASTTAFINATYR